MDYMAQNIVQGVFVFVVCGGKEHIDTLNFSLPYLKKYSKNRIVVVTDSKRNEGAIHHDDIIDVETDQNYDNHQASIYLKTGLHKIMPKGARYCYLDTDILAISIECDNIFEEYIPPITFAPDHCKVQKFSAYAVNCGCTEKWKKDRDVWEKAMDKYDRNRQITDPEVLAKAEKLKKKFTVIAQSSVSKAWTAIRYFSSIGTFKLDDEFSFDKRKRVWKDREGTEVMYEVNVKKIEQETGFKYNRWSQIWENQDGENIWQDECSHLQKQIAETFGVVVGEKNWQHWNGGVFLFDDDSYDFMDSWHNKSIEIWKYPEWKTRDQGTLITTVWEQGLQNHLTLSKKWNFITDYYNTKLMLDEEKGIITDDAYQTQYQPAFMHIYHHFGDETWDVWNWAASKIESEVKQ